MTRPMHTFRDDFRRQAALYRDRPAFIAEASDRRYSYGDLIALVQRFSTLLHRQGLKAEDKVASLLPNSAEALVAFLAVTRDGLAFAPASPDVSADEIRQWLALNRPALCLISRTVHPHQQKALDEAGVRTITIDLDGDFTWLPTETTDRTIGPSAGRLHVTTSGSTGEPRAIVLDIDRLWSSGKAFLAQHPFVNEDSRFLNILPMYYLGGLFNLGLIPLSAGAATVLAEPFSGKSFLNFWQTVERYEIDVLWVVPTMVRGLLTLAERTHRNQVAATPRSKVAFLGTAPIDRETKERFERVFGIPLLENFALSETTFFTSETMTTRLCRSDGSVGQRLDYAEIRLVAHADEDDEGKTFSEICVRSPYLFLGYQDASGAINLPLDEDGFFATGDIGHFDASGNLVIDGRRRDIIKKGGVFIALREIEVIVDSHPDVQESAAVMVPHDFYGEAFILFVRVRPGHEGPGLKDELGKWLRERIGRTKWPERIEIVAQFPRTASGKVRKALLAADASPQK